jgi:hypothetical protein
MNELHIHVDAEKLSEELSSYLLNLGFWRSDFVEHVQHSGYEPLHHLTLKPKTSIEFRKTFDSLVEWLERHPGHIEGYIEGEVIPLDEDIAESSFREDVIIPCRITTSNLPIGTFRESEIHITLDRDRSHPELRRRLKQIGLFSAFLPKSYGIAEVFTVQGSQIHINSLLPALRNYLSKAGGAVQCSIKEERVARWWVNRPNTLLPPVVSAILWEPSAYWAPGLVE